MNRWLQTRQYQCIGCGAWLLHDKMYRHVGFECPRRVMPTELKAPHKRLT
jgi:DNA-directed RNA polymerase subunit RPC12/RpoP